MKLLLRRILDRCVAAAPPYVLNRMLKTFYLNRDLSLRAGYQVFPVVFYSPIPNPDEFDMEALRSRRNLPAIPLPLEKFAPLVTELGRFRDEITFPTDPKTGSLEWADSYGSVDTAALYAMIRHLRPRRYIEVGCGYSTRASTAAIRKNQSEGHPCEAVFIEPFPAAYFQRENLPGEFVQERIENVPMERFKALQAGDVLFIDTSHIVKVQSDVVFELLEVLPSLAPGVFVHVHDIFTPYDYPVDWVASKGPRRGGNSAVNEQYALECLLSGGSNWEVVLPLYLLWKEARPSLAQLFAGAPTTPDTDRPAAVWLRRAP